jgi:D-2-hydroxyacid dehydrogenase (NADP+)
MKTPLVNFFFKEQGKQILVLAKEFPEISFEVCTNEKELLNRLPKAEILIGTHVTEKMLRVATRLKWIQSFFAGVDHYPLKEMEKRGLILTSGRGIAAINLSEYVICALIMLARNFSVIAKNQKNKKWDKIKQSEINGTTLGILGLGAIGKEVAKKAVSMGMNVIALKKTFEETDYVEELYTPERMDEIFRKSDYVVNLLPYLPETQKVVDRKYFNLMKPTASFVNVSRGKTVNEEDLIEALKSKKIKGLVSDVFYNEPLPQTSPLWEMENVFITPHIAGESIKYIEKALEIIRHNLSIYLSREGELLNRVDFKKGY